MSFTTIAGVAVAVIAATSLLICSGPIGVGAGGIAALILPAVGSAAAHFGFNCFSSPIAAAATSTMSLTITAVSLVKAAIPAIRTIWKRLFK